MAFVITGLAGLMASMSFLNHGTLLLGHLFGTLRVLCKHFVHHLHFELGALVAICVLAS